MTTFISYSRVNSEFAVRLAKDLKMASYDIWFDQLDISTGSRWDDEIEKALEASNTFLIVLSPESIQSQNVKDEIGYAIDAGKHILPVVIENCKVPFRLRRFQYVDFTGKPYEESLTKIKYLLGKSVETVAESKNVNEREEEKIHPPPNNSIAQEKIAAEPKPVYVPETQGGKPGGKWMPRILVAILGVMAIVFVAIFSGIFTAKESAEVDDVSLEPAASIASVIISTPLSTETQTSIPPSETPTITTPASLPAEILDDKGVRMLLVPEGDFMAGSENGEADEKPAHTIYLDSYYMDKYEVTNILYGACVAAGVCDPPKQSNSYTRASYYGNTQFDNFPVIYVDWNMAKTYCEWRGEQLPTEAQWEKAARGTDGRTYPWGEEIECAKANYAGCGRDTEVVGSDESGKSTYGIYDMSGNVWEWVADWYSAEYYQNSPVANPPGPDSGINRIMRGGSWADLASSSRSANRHGNDPFTFGNSVGFRCAMDADP